MVTINESSLTFHRGIARRNILHEISRNDDEIEKMTAGFRNSKETKGDGSRR